MKARFGDCIFDGERHLVERRGEVVHLPPKAFALLALLIDAAPNALSREAIYAALWSDTFVEEGSLHALVSELRIALGDEGREIIRTIHRFGYAFAAPLRRELPSLRSALVVGGRSWPLHGGENVVGRDPAADVVIDAASVSRRHAVIRVEGTEARVADLESKNGTFLGGAPVGEGAVLSDGDEIVFGTVAARWEVVRDDASTETA